MRGVCLCNTRPGVLDGQEDAPVLAPDMKRHRRSGRRMDNRVTDERPADLEHALLVGKSVHVRGDPLQERVLGLLCDGAKLLHERAGDRTEVDRLGFDAEVPRIDP